MRATATVGLMVTALAGCGRDADNRAGTADPVRRASFRSLAARDFLATCPGSAARAETRRELERLAELNRFAFEKGALASLQLAANDWAGLAARDRRAPCAPGEAAYRAALAEFATSLDGLAAGIREYRP
jgi:hypothetical protein